MRVERLELWGAFAGGFNDCRGDGDQFGKILEEGVEFGSGKDVCLDYEAEPVMSFAGFFAGDIYLCNKVCADLDTVSFFDVCTD